MSEPIVPSSPSKRWLTRGVLGIGLASLFSDWGHEAATAILPVFLASLGAPAVALGIIEGVSDGLSSFAKLAGGFVADHAPMAEADRDHRLLRDGGDDVRLRVRAELAGRAAACAAFGWMGRGSRGPSRDALLADCVAAGTDGPRFRIRARDGHARRGAGAALRNAADRRTRDARGVLRWTLLPGLTAAVCFALLAPGAKKVDGQSRAGAFVLWRRGSRNSQRFTGIYLAGVFAHGIGDFAPTLLILRAGQILTPRYGGAPGRGHIASGSTRFTILVTRRRRIRPARWRTESASADCSRSVTSVGVITYIGFIFEQPTIPVLVVLFGLAGIHDAVQQSLEKSVAAELLPREVRGTGFGVLATANGIGDFMSSIAVGALWSLVSPAAGFLYAGVFAALGAILIYSSRGSGS